MSSSDFPNSNFPSLTPTTIVPENDDLFISYFNRTYENIADVVNNKDDKYFTLAITDTATDIPNFPNFGSFIICVSGEQAETDNTGTITGWLPTITASVCKSSGSSSASIVTLGSQAGTGTWAGINLTISSTSTSIQIAHNNSGVSGNFNLKFIGTQI